MNAAVFSFIRPTKISTVASVRIARFIARTLNLPLLYAADVQDTRWDVLILVNGAFSFCAARDEVAKAVRQAKRVIWVQNDYMIYAPVNNGTAESVFRRAFVRRKEKSLPDLDHWTTIKEKATLTKGSRYINWNMLTALRTPLAFSRHTSNDLFYYGAYRVRRRASFDRYFAGQKLPITLSSSNKRFLAQYSHAQVLPSIARDAFYRELNRHGLGLYIEDTRSHQHFHSPANRFYEMLSAGLPMVFEPESAPMLTKAGYDVTPYIIQRQRDAVSAMKDRALIQRAQIEFWWDNFQERLTKKLVRAFDAYTQEYL